MTRGLDNGSTRRDVERAIEDMSLPGEGEGPHPLFAAWGQSAGASPAEIEREWESVCRLAAQADRGPMAQAWVMDLSGDLFDREEQNG